MITRRRLTGAQQSWEDDFIRDNKENECNNRNVNRKSRRLQSILLQKRKTIGATRTNSKRFSESPIQEHNVDSVLRKSMIETPDTVMKTHRNRQKVSVAKNEAKRILIGLTPARERAQEQIKNLMMVNKKATLQQPSVNQNHYTASSPVHSHTSSPAAHIDCDDDEVCVGEEKEEDDAHHGVYGKLLHDFGFKQLYLASAKQICKNVAIWHLQRPTSQDRVNSIYAAKKDCKEFAGVISLFDFVNHESSSIQCPQKCGIFDGQHRILAISKMVQEEEVDLDILVEVFPVTSNKQVNDIFLEINKAETVQEIDLPDSIAPASRRIIDAVCRHLQQTYPDMFKGARCRCPHLNLDILRNELFKANVVEKRHITSSEQLLSILETKNRVLKARPLNQWPVNLRRYLKKAKATGFYLGVDKQWLAEL